MKALFPTSVVGSLPRPAFVLDLINDRPPLPRQHYEQRMQAAVRYAVAMQEQAGLDVVTDGEWWRKSYIGVIAELAHGFKLGTLPDGRPFTMVVGKLAPKTPGFVAREVAFLKTINELVDGISGIKLAVHLCRRAGARSRGEQSHAGGYEPIIDHLNRLKVHHLTMEFTAPQAGDMSVFRELRPDLEIGLGCLDVTPGRIDSAETIASRVRQALKHLAPERITLNPDCGFAPGSGAVVSMDEAYRKLCNQSEAARLLRAEFTSSFS